MKTTQSFCRDGVCAAGIGLVAGTAQYLLCLVLTGLILFH